MTGHTFIPAAHFHVLSPLYEPMLRPFWSRMWQRIAREASARAPKGGTVVDIGCGPGSVLRFLAKERTDLTLIGTDVDLHMLAIARKKAANLRIRFEQASAEHIPADGGSVDIVISSLMFHHLPLETKQQTFAEVRRVLKPAGGFILCDFSKPPDNGRKRRLRFWTRIERETIPQLQGQLLELGKEAGAREASLWSAYGSIVCHLFTFPSRAHGS